MSLRPRYSLLTLLVLMALIAGGVKLWYGPHHVVERPSPQLELEYTYYRTWGTEKILQGPQVQRTFNDRQLFRVNIEYWRHGEVVPDWKHEFFDIGNPQRNAVRDAARPTQADSPLAPQEWQEFQAAVEREHGRLREAGLRYDDYQGTVFHFFIGVGR